MHHITPHLNRKVATDGPGLGLQRVGGADDLAGGLDHALALPHHAHHWAGQNVVYQGREEGLGAEVLVVLLSDVAGALEELQASQGEPLALETGDDLANKAALDTCKRDRSCENLFPPEDLR